MVFHLPTRVRFGRGRIRELRSVIPRGIERVLIVSDQRVFEKSGAVEAIADSLRHLDVGLFCDVEPNPSFATIDAGGAAARDSGSQLVIGLGGGSPMDVAKGIAVLATNDTSMQCVMCGGELIREPLPVICIPTTSGTGSEVTPYAVFSDPEDQSKQGYSHPGLFPICALIDPQLTFSMPKSVVIDTGLDVLTHAIEAYLSTEAMPFSDLFALRAVEVVLDNLAAAAGKDPDAMTAMSYAATSAGVAIAHAGTILLHVMGYPLTVFHQVPHGRANAALLPVFMEFMAERSRVAERIAHVEQLFAGHGGIRGFIEDLGVSTNLSTYGAAEGELGLFVSKCIIKDDLKITPAEVHEGDIRRIYERAMT